MNTLTRLAAPAAAALALFAATALPAAAAPLVSINGPEAAQFMQQQARARAAERRAHKAKAARVGAQLEDDVTPPVLTAFQIETTVNTRKQGEQAVVSFTAEDDLSGLQDFYVTLRGPSGQAIGGWSYYRSYHDTRWEGEMSDLMESGGAYEPGPWKVESVQVYDWVGNVSNYDTAALAALGGNTTVMVKNRTYDRAAPSLVAGDILTPTVSVSNKRPGQPGVFGDDVKLRVTVADSAFGPVTSGINTVTLWFCRWVGKTCQSSISAQATPYLWGVTERAFTLGQAIGPNQPTGIYTLYQLSVSDNAGNNVSYTDRNRDGADFAAFFPGGVTVDVQP